jgi:hypothetical protein
MNIPRRDAVLDIHVLDDLWIRSELRDIPDSILQRSAHVDSQFSRRLLVDPGAQQFRNNGRPSAPGGADASLPRLVRASSTNSSRPTEVAASPKGALHSGL